MLPSNLLRPTSTPSLLHPLPLRRRPPSRPRRRHSPAVAFPNFSATTNLKVCALDMGRSADVDGRNITDLPVELCVTYELEPAVTLKEGVEKIKEAVRRLRLEPPCSRSGVVRFEIRIPPSIKASSWYYAQFQSEAFPQFLVYVECQESSEFSLYGMTGVAGVGASIYLQDSSLMEKGDSIMRYLSVDSPMIRAYGFVGIEFSARSPLGTRGDSLYSIFIPQIELNEFEDKSILASTVVWDDFLCQTFPDAIKSAEFSLHHVVDCAALSNKSLLYNDVWLHIIDGRLDVFSAKQVQRAFLSTENQDGARISQSHVPVLHRSDFHLYFRLSKMVALTSSTTTHSGRPNFSMNQYPNINSVWASLIVEECVRHGLVYFCIAPGSRSSPLAIAAASHPQTTCTSCFDERSLAFHAIGYAKGSCNPAVVITSSGTAVSNLLPAVVEASQDFIPVLLLTADRPPELHDAGANQSINQVDHFGKFVRFFFNLPPPSDEVPARFVLTTVDSAIYHANGTPRGPAHINCPFREPLDNSPREWTSTCLNGLDHWMSNYKPFTTYINLQKFHFCRELSGEIGEILEIIQNAERGILLIGSVESEDEIWAALLLAKHLSWPVVPDILSGLRIRKMSNPIRNEILFIDHLDHALLSDLAKSWPQPDAVLQLGSRITSRRVSQLLEQCPQKYILVEEHPCRHDPSHVITHRIQCSITAFTEVFIKCQFPMKTAKWRNFLQAMEMMVASELSSQIHLENSLTEPHVAQVIASVLQDDTFLFIGNSMVIRDMDMYGISAQSATNIPCLSSMNRFPYQGIRIAANRGASGIDGLLSSAVGFAAGCNKRDNDSLRVPMVIVATVASDPIWMTISPSSRFRCLETYATDCIHVQKHWSQQSNFLLVLRVLCLVGDVSFLHDTNGLAILNERMQRKPVTVLVVNNHGGAIFSLLPIAERTQAKILDKFFYTSHNISISKLCAAHCIKHLYVQTKGQLQHALSESLQIHADTVIEVESRISDNAAFHRILRESARQVANHVFKGSLLVSDCVGDGLSSWRISRMGYSLYRVQLFAPPTTTTNQEIDHHREGFILSLTLDDGSIGYGEVVPTEIHKEDIIDVEEQLRFLLHTMEGAEISNLLPLLRGSFSVWFWRAFGITSTSLFPSVRCGIEMAVLNALACKSGSSFSEVILGSGNPLKSGSPSVSMGKTLRSDHVQICALVDCGGTPKEVAHVVSSLVEEGFYTVKLKVARRANPIEDADVIKEIRNSVGYQIHIRVDANRRWSYEEAVIFGNNVKNFMLQYIEEPLQCEDDILRYCEETGLPVALDETIDDLKGDVAFKLSKFIHPGIVAVVIKPNMIGGIEMAALVARWAQLHDKMAVISSTFESGLSLFVYIQFAHYLDQQKASVCQMRGIEVSPAIAHGLGTYKWLKEDIADKHFKFSVQQLDGVAGVFVKDAAIMLNNFTVSERNIQRNYGGDKITSYFSVVDCEYFSCSVRLLETDIGLNKKVVVFLHGFLGASEEWVPIMKALSVHAQCISLDLPGHGQSETSWKKEAGNAPSMSVEAVGDMLHQLLCSITTKSVVLVGYSMGARIALYMSLKYTCKIEGVALISGSPGLRKESLRKARIAQDDARARYLSAHGFKPFLEIWYSSSLWNSLREHPLFEQILESREKHRSPDGVAKCLSDLSVGRQVSLWENLRHCKTRLLLIVGERDEKFKEIAQQMHDEIGLDSNENLCDIMEVEACGHAVHLENPLAVINAVSKFFIRDSSV